MNLHDLITFGAKKFVSLLIWLSSTDSTIIEIKSSIQSFSSTKKTLDQFQSKDRKILFSLYLGRKKMESYHSLCCAKLNAMNLTTICTQYAKSTF